MTPDNQVQQATDFVVGGTAISVALSAPVWLEWVNLFAKEVMLLGGATIILYRLGAIIWGWWKKKKE